jgi:hypothetical protein
VTTTTNMRVSEGRRACFVTAPLAKTSGLDVTGARSQQAIYAYRGR